MPAMSEEAIDPAELLERLRSEPSPASWAPLLPSGVAASWRDLRLSGLEPLAYVNAHWALPDRGGPGGSTRGIRSAARRLISRVTYSVLGDYLREERELLVHLVQVCNALATRCDEMATVIADRELAEAENGARLVEFLTLRDREPRPATRE
jgi:hypothetical protein